MELDQLIQHWKQVRASLLDTIDKFSDQDLAFVPFANSWSTAQLILHIAQEEQGEIGYGVMGSLSEWPPEFPPQAYPSVASIKAVLGQVHSATEAYLNGLEETDLDRAVNAPWGKTFRHGEMLWHTLEHEIHHRAELSLILGMLGRKGLDA